MTSLTKLALALSALAGPTLQVPACQLVDLESAQALLGGDAYETSGGSEPSLCMYTDATATGLLSARVMPGDTYDLIKIQEPSSDAAIGERSRFNEGETGVLALQFVKGGVHVTIGIVPIANEAADVESFKQIVRTAAERIP